MEDATVPGGRGAVAPTVDATTYRGRFAPSPTGSLHLGNARTALLAWVRARVAGGVFIVRVEDLDGPRTRPDALEGNLDELAWLGLTWDEGPGVGGPDEPYLQSRRALLYRAALDRLVETGSVFECYLSRKDVASASSAPHATTDGAANGAAFGAVYGAAQRRLNRAVADQRRAAGRSPSLRLAAASVADTPTRPVSIEFIDAIAGRQTFDARRDIGDIVLLRSDGLWAYQLAVTVDDAAMGVTEVVRGADLLTSTAAQLLITRALGLTPPGYAHVGLLLDEDGKRLSKRHGPLSLSDLRRARVAPERALGLLAYTLGWLDAPEPIAVMDILDRVEPRRLAAPTPGPVRLTASDLAYLTDTH